MRSERIKAGLHFLRRQQSFLLGRYAAKLALQYALRVPDLKAIEIGRGVLEQPAVPYLSANTAGGTIGHSNDDQALQRDCGGASLPAGHPMVVDIERIDPAWMITFQSQLSPVECAWARSAGANEITLSTLPWTAKDGLKGIDCGLMSQMEIVNLSEGLDFDAVISKGKKSEALMLCGSSRSHPSCV